MEKVYIQNKSTVPAGATHYSQCHKTFYKVSKNMVFLWEEPNGYKDITTNIGVTFKRQTVSGTVEECINAWLMFPMIQMEEIAFVEQKDYAPYDKSKSKGSKEQVLPVSGVCTIGMKEGEVEKYFRKSDWTGLATRDLRKEDLPAIKVPKLVPVKKAHPALTGIITISPIAAIGNVKKFHD